WLVGMNLSRAYSLTFNEELSVGRGQTPTLAMLVEKEIAIRNFVVEEYLEVQATFGSVVSKEKYRGVWFRSKPEETHLPVDGLEVQIIVERARVGKASVESINSTTQRAAPPLLYDLTELQRQANRLFGFSAQKTLDVAQALYEKHKLISYPRTDSRHLSKDVAAKAPTTAEGIGGGYPGRAAPAPRAGPPAA